MTIRHLADILANADELQYAIANSDIDPVVRYLDEEFEDDLFSAYQIREAMVLVQKDPYFAKYVMPVMKKR